MADQAAPGGQSVYPLPPGDYSDVGYRYEDAPAPAPPPAAALPLPPQAQPIYAEQSVESSPVAGPQSASKSKGSGEVKPRLRKACDSCSVRKVKCDESGPPCKSCAALDIPCTFNRPSRRRGPPNRHAEAIKRQRLEDGSYSYDPMAQVQAQAQAATHMAASPTRDAAYGLAALSAPMPQQLSADMICDLATLNVLVDDYFTYIHPVVPVPHEPTFREQLRRRDDLRDRTFLALLAAMIETLVTSFPRRVKQVFSSPEARAQFPNASALITRCHSVFTEARGKGFIDRDDLNLYDACGSYMAALSAAYVLDARRWRLYCSEAVAILRVTNHQKADNAATYDPGVNLVDQQVSRRLFWLCFVGTMTLRQLGGRDSDILMPHARSEPLPPMPLEVDDKYITPDQDLGQPPDELSEITGFNYNVKIYRAFYAMTAAEMAFGSDVLYDWDRQRMSIRTAISDVKAITKEVPPELRLEKRQDIADWPPRQDDISQYSHLFNSRRDPSADHLGPLPPHDTRRTTPYPRKVVQFEMQKANIHGTQLATRSYLVERYWNLYEIREQELASQQAMSDNKLSRQSSPTVSHLATGLENRFQPPRSAHTPSDSLDVDEGEQQMAVEREGIVRDMARLLKSVNQVNMEPNGHSFCHKIRQVASTLLSQNRSPMSRMPTLDNEEVQEYLRGFIDILAKLERIGSSLTKGGDQGFTPHISIDQQQYQSGGQYQAGQQMPQGQEHLAGISAYAGQTQEEIEEEELVQWASLKEHQEKFAMKHEGYLSL